MATIQGIYIALFGRPADPAGLEFFNEATNNGADLTAIGDLASTAEYQDRFTGMSNEEIINSIYLSLFERDGEAEGVAFYVAALESGELNINNIAIAILDGAQGSDLDTVNAKIAAANLFTERLDLDEEVEAYDGEDAAQVGRDYINSINTDNPGTPANADAAILLLFPSEGQQPGGGGGGGARPTFFIENVEGTLKFSGTATAGDVTLHFDPDTGILSGSRGNVTATIVNGPILEADVADALLITDTVISAGTLHVSAANADGWELTGAGAVHISGSEGGQALTVLTTGENVIEGGLGADIITVGDGADLGKFTFGNHVELETGVSAVESLIAEREDLRDAVTDAEGIVEEQAGLQSAVDDLEGLQAEREGLEEDVAEAQAAVDARDGLISDLATAQEIAADRASYNDAVVDTQQALDADIQADGPRVQLVAELALANGAAGARQALIDAYDNAPNPIAKFAAGVALQAARSNFGSDAEVFGARDAAVAALEERDQLIAARDEAESNLAQHRADHGTDVEVESNVQQATAELEEARASASDAQLDQQLADAQGALDAHVGEHGDVEAQLEQARDALAEHQADHPDPQGAVEAAEQAVDQHIDANGTDDELAADLADAQAALEDARDSDSTLDAMDIITGADLSQDSPDFDVNFVDYLYGSGGTVEDAVAGLLSEGAEIEADGTYVLVLSVGDSLRTVAYIDNGDGIVSYTDDLFIELVGFEAQIPSS